MIKRTISVLAKSNFTTLLCIIVLFILGCIFPFKVIFAREVWAQTNESDFTESLCKGDFDTAIQKLSQDIAMNHLDPGAHHNLACVYALKEDYSKAIDEFEKAGELDASDFKAIIYFNEGMVYLKQKSYENASNMLKKSIELFPGMDLVDDFRTINSICIGAAQGNVGYERLNLSLFEDSPFLPDTSCLATERMKQYNLEVYVFKDLSPLPLFFYRSKRALLFLGASYFEQKDYLEAEKKFKAALTVKDMDRKGTTILAEAPVNYYLGLIELHNARYQEAIDYFKKATEIMQNNFGYFRELAFAYFLNHDYTSAKKNCEIALNLNPDDEKAKSILEDAEKEIKRGEVK